MPFKITIEDNVIDDYVVDCSDIPIVERNLDYSLIASEFTLKIAATYPTHTPATNDEVKVYADSGSSYPVFLGIIKEISFDYDNLYWEINVSHIFSKLKDKTVTYDNLHSYLIDTANNNYYIATDNQGYPNVNVLWLMKQMCVAVGISLDISSLEADSAGTLYENKYISSLATTRNFYLGDLKFDENMLYALNQEEVGFHTIWEAKVTRIRLAPTYFELFSILMSYMGLTIGINQAGTPEAFTLYLKDNAYERTIADDIVFAKTTGNIIGEKDGVNWVGNFSARSGYASGSGTAYTEQFSDGYLDKVQNLNVYTNFLMLYRDDRASQTDGKVFAYAGGAHHENGDGCASYSVMCNNQQKAICDDWETYEIESTIVLTAIAPLKRMTINIEKNTATYEGVFQ